MWAFINMTVDLSITFPCMCRASPRTDMSHSDEYKYYFAMELILTITIIFILLVLHTFACTCCTVIIIRQ